MRGVQDVFDDYVKLNTRIQPEMLVSVRTIDEPGRLADTIVAHVALKLKDKQELLETPSPAKRLRRRGELMQGEIEIRQVEKKLPHARQEADGEAAEGVLPERADAGHRLRSWVIATSSRTSSRSSSRRSRPRR